MEAKERVRGALNNDMLGWMNDNRLDNTIRYSNAGLRDVQHAAAFLFSDLITYDAHYFKFTDAHSLYDGFGDVVAGIGSYPDPGQPALPPAARRAGDGEPAPGGRGGRRRRSRR